ncbi:MAG: CocE/NonD family hydrolase [Aquabacterium sp.]|uniref:CocE/NonD family hydrolase n=1 Tax=Aquabacterium sp. TaxID=1872578 RepID=UPI001B555955|nr:CocE/NonD family hydrolase [Aquabacterium sp.]MBP7132505.1 CocE/NonD family hydrolase [Aquabacterium sp.]
MTIRTRTIRPFALATLASCILAGFMVNASAQTTTLGTRGSLSQANAPTTSNAQASWSTYDRSADYPRSITLPLQYITTSTGDKLSVRVSVPANFWGQQVSGKFPVILTQTAYRNGLGQLLGSIATGDTTLIIGGKDDYMIRRGYITVAVDAWGTGMSTGETQLIGEAEQQAYGEAVKWVTQQPWFNGNLGLAGTSYLGITSMLTAKQQHPSVKAVFAAVPMGDAFRGVVGVGGMMNAQFLSIWLPLTHGLSVGALNTLDQMLNPKLASTIKLANQQHIDAIDSWYLPTVQNGLNGQTGIATDDGSFWSVRSPIEGANQIKVPTFLVGGTNDIFQRDVPLMYEQVKRNANTKLLVLPGSHVGSILKLISGSDGIPKGRHLLLQWFDQYLKGKSTGAANMPNVTQYVQGYGTDSTQRYARTTDWPHPQMSAQRMYLREGKSLSAQAPTSTEVAASVSEPVAPVVTVERSGDSVKSDVTLNDGSKCSSSYDQWTLGIGGILGGSCYKDATKVETAQKAAIYETPVLTTDLYLNGPIQADVWMTTTRTDAALAVRVDSVSPDGVATPITTGLMSARYRAVDTSRSRYVNGIMIQPWHAYTAASAQNVVPGKPMLVPVEIFPNAALIRAGHKLRVAISASNQAQGVWPLPNQANANGGTTVILNSAEHPSSVVLPVVPASSLN